MLCYSRISTVLITDPQQNAFGTKLNGSISNAGPCTCPYFRVFSSILILFLLVDAKISFPEGATVAWSGQPLGNIKMDDISVTGDVGAQFSVNSQFKVADVGHLTDFTKVRAG